MVRRFRSTCAHKPPLSNPIRQSAIRASEQRDLFINRLYLCGTNTCAWAARSQRCRNHSNIDPSAVYPINSQVFYKFKSSPLKHSGPILRVDDNHRFSLRSPVEQRQERFRTLLQPRKQVLLPDNFTLRKKGRHFREESSIIFGCV